MPEGFEIAEVLYFFRYTRSNTEKVPLAMVSVFGVPDRGLLAESYGTLWAAKPELGGIRVIPAKSIQSVVAMIPFPDNRGVPEAVEHRFKGMYYLYEKLGLSSSDE
jgi:hypothetical protein